VQRRHPLRRHGRALARRPRSPSTPPGPHPAARRGLRSRRVLAVRMRTAETPHGWLSGHRERGQIRPLSPVTLLTGGKIHHHALRLRPPPLMLSSRLPGAVAGNCSTPGITQRSPGRSTPRLIRRRRSPSGSLMIRSWTGKSVRPSPQEASDPGQWITPRRAIFAVRDPRPPHQICHRRPVNSWVTKPGARLSRAGVATRPASTSLCVSSERFRPAQPGRWPSDTTGRQPSDRQRQHGTGVAAG
jgi:hypothetical protein